MKVYLGNNTEFELFQIEEAEFVENLAIEIEGEVHSRKQKLSTIGLNKGFL